MSCEYTDNAREAMRLANEEALRYNHKLVDTEHLLMGLIKQGSGTGARILIELIGDLRKISLEVEKHMVSETIPATRGRLPITMQVKDAVAWALQEAKRFERTAVGTEDILLGLILEGKGVAAQVLDNLDVTLRAVRGKCQELTAKESGDESGLSGDLSDLIERVERELLLLEQTHVRLAGYALEYGGLKDRRMDRLQSLFMAVTRLGQAHAALYSLFVDCHARS